MTNSAPKSQPGRGMSLFALVASLALCAFASPIALADSTQFGELLVAKGVTVNGTTATGGLTVLSGSQIATRQDGRAIVNLGKVGRVTLGSETQIALNFADGKIQGDLLSGWAIISAPAGVEIAIKTADGIAASDGNKASSMRIDLTGGTTRVTSDSAAKLTEAQKTEFVAAGEEVEFSHENGTFAVARRSLEAEPEVAVSTGFGEVLATSVRTALESVILDRTLATPSSSSPSDELTRRAFASDTAGTQLVEQAVTCGDFNELCGGLEVGCDILPIIIKAKAGCTLSFILQSSNVQIPAHVTIRPFMSNACFFLTPYYPQVVTLYPGQGYVGQINARNCPRNAYQFAQNTLIVVESDTCGTNYIRVEWATPCI